MRNILTIRDVPSPRYWTVRIPKPRLPHLSKATIRWTAALALSLGFNVGFLSEAFALEASECELSAELHYEMSGGDDATYEDAYAACQQGMRYADWRAEQLDAIYDQAPGCLEYAELESSRCTTETAWAERVPGGWIPVCGDADGNPVGAP
jgi:hypothetical protein